MTISSTKTWESKRTDETRRIEALLGSVFEQADAYRYDSASIGIRAFEAMPREKRDAMVEEQIEKLPPHPDETRRPAKV